MMMDAGVWTAEARLPVDSFLDRVEIGLLNAGVVRTIRATVIKTLEADITQRVCRSAGGESPGAPAVKAALDEMGIAPTGVATDSAAGGRAWGRYVRSLMPRRSRAALWGAICIALSLLPMIAVLVLLQFFSPSGLRVEADFPRDQVHAELGVGGQPVTLFRATAPDGSVHAAVIGASPIKALFALFLPISPLALAGTLLGLFATVDILASRGKVKGLPTALFALLFYPVLLAMISLWLMQV